MAILEALLGGASGDETSIPAAPQRVLPLPQAQLRGDFADNIKALRTKAGRRFVKDAGNQQALENGKDAIRLYIALLTASPMLALLNSWAIIIGASKIGIVDKRQAMALQLIVATHAMKGTGVLGTAALAALALTAVPTLTENGETLSIAPADLVNYNTIWDAIKIAIGAVPIPGTDQLADLLP